MDRGSAARELPQRAYRVFRDAYLELWCGDCRSACSVFAADEFDLCIADPPYNQTSLQWDRWPEGWVNAIGPLISQQGSLWCYGSLRMFMDRREEFHGWKLAQDIVWRKQNGTTFHADRFRRVHEQIAHFYRGNWRDVYRDVQTTADAVAKTVTRGQSPAHTGQIRVGHYKSKKGGRRLMRSVLDVRNCHGRAIHPTEKPTQLIEPIIEYSCRKGGRVFVPFAGSGSELEAARELGCHAIGFEIDPKYCEKAKRRLQRSRRSMFAR